MKKQYKIITLLATLCFNGSVFADAPRDPTRPPNAIDTTDKQLAINGPLTLTAIFTYNGNRKVAIINQQAVVIGDKLGNFSVTSITQNAVELVDEDQKTLTLELSPDVKRRSR